MGVTVVVAIVVLSIKDKVRLWIHSVGGNKMGNRSKRGNSDVNNRQCCHDSAGCAISTKYTLNLMKCLSQPRGMIIVEYCMTCHRVIGNATKLNAKQSKKHILPLFCGLRIVTYSH